MTHQQVTPQVSGRFRARLSPHRSLDRLHFKCAAAILGLAVVAASTALLAFGAWPVAVYLGLVIALTLCAFRLNYRSGERYELVELSDGALTLTRVPASGPAIAFRFNPYWVRFDLNRSRDGRPQLSLTSHGRRLIFGAFLSDDEKRDFAAAFARELARNQGRA